MTFRYCESCDKRGKAGNGIRTYTYGKKSIELCFECAERIDQIVNEVMTDAIESVWSRADEMQDGPSNGAGGQA